MLTVFITSMAVLQLHSSVICMYVILGQLLAVAANAKGVYIS